MFGNKEQIKVVQDIRDSKSKTEHISDYIESLKAIEDCMEPFKEQKRELKAEHLEKKWLSKEDISLSVRALTLSGVKPILCSWSLISFGTPIIIYDFA